MTKEPKIGGVPASAPLWRGAPAEDLTAIVGHLSSASYHYADDSSGEWGTARLHVEDAARLVNLHDLDFSAMYVLLTDKPQLVSFGQFVNAVLQGLRAK